MPRYHGRRPRHEASMLELVVVIVVIVIALRLALPLYDHFQHQAR